MQGHPEYARHGWLMEAHVLIPERREDRRKAKRNRWETRGARKKVEETGGETSLARRVAWAG